MRLVLNLSALLILAGSATAFAPGKAAFRRTSAVVVKGYLDDLTAELYSEADEPDVEADSFENTKMDKGDIDRAGPGTWKDYVDFEEFDGGDGQMGVAGDGKQGLEKEWKGEAQMAKSKMMSARNAWGSTSGYADKLIAEGWDNQKAQRLENWHNQQAVLRTRKAHRYMTDEFDKVKEDEDWRNLGSFEASTRNEDFDLDEAFGAVKPGEDIEGEIELKSRISQPQIHEFLLKNSMMGFSDFRAAVISESKEWTVEPKEGAINGKTGVDFRVRFRPSGLGVSEGYLVIDTEDKKWTWKLIGSTG